MSACLIWAACVASTCTQAPTKHPEVRRDSWECCMSASERDSRPCAMGGVQGAALYVHASAAELGQRHARHPQLLAGKLQWAP